MSYMAGEEEDCLMSRKTFYATITVSGNRDGRPEEWISRLWRDTIDEMMEAIAVRKLDFNENQSDCGEYEFDTFTVSEVTEFSVVSVRTVHPADIEATQAWQEHLHRKREAEEEKRRAQYVSDEERKKAEQAEYQRLQAIYGPKA